MSFSPAITETLFEMGLGDHVVAVTRFCRLPEGVHRPAVGSELEINSDAILAARPDVILTQSDPAKFKGVVDIEPGIKIVQIRLEKLDDIEASIVQIGRVLGREDLARKHKADFVAKIQAVRRRVQNLSPKRVLFVMGTDRPIAAGEGNFVHDMIEIAGGINAGADIPGPTRWRQTHIDSIAKTAPDIIICQDFQASGSRQSKEYWLGWKDLPAARSGRVYVVCDRGWSIPSVRVTELTSALADMIHSDEVFTVGETTISLSLAWLYRMLAAAVVGAALGAAGMALQALLRNPLAEPYILGISSGAGVGVLMGLALSGWCAVPSWASMPLLAFVGAAITCAAVYAVAQRRGRLDPYTLILSGVIVNSFNGAIMLTIYLYIDPHRIADFVHWAMGRLPDSTNLSLLAVCSLCVVAGWVMLLLKGAALNVLSLGDEVAGTSGVAVHRLRTVIFLFVGLMTAAAVALAGPIGFVGLIIPHICRMVIGPDHRLGIAVSGIVGAVFLMAAEALCRLAGPLVGVSLIPVGILTALGGGPFFIYLLRRRFREVPA